MKKFFMVMAVCVSMMTLITGCSGKNDKLVNGGIRYELNDVTNNEGEISANDAIVLISMNLAPESAHNIISETLIYSVEGRDTVENMECYIISFGPEKNNKFKEEKKYAVDVHGRFVFEQSKKNKWDEVYTETAAE